LQDVGPGGGDTWQSGRVVEPGPYRRLAVAEVGHGTLQRVERGRMAAGGGRMGV
jgi:hypothetical protein